MLSTRKHTERWQRLTNGYGKYWYFKSFVRWVSLITAAVNLIVFGAVWRDYAQYYYGENAQIGMWAFAIACVSFLSVVSRAQVPTDYYSSLCSQPLCMRLLSSRFSGCAKAQTSILAFF